MATLPKPTTLWLRRAAFAAGLVAAATLVALGRFAPARTPLGLDVTVTTSPTGELAVAPIGKVVDAGALAPGRGAAHGSITLSNQTSAELRVSLRAAPSIGDADAALHVRLRAGGETLYDGAAGGLRRATRRALAIAPHATAVLAVDAWLPAGAGAGWRGRSVTIPLEYRSSIRGRVRR